MSKIAARFFVLIRKTIIGDPVISNLAVHSNFA
jgi:hypothetical protein